MKTWLKVLIIVLVVLVGAAFLKDQIIKFSVETAGSAIVGAPIRIGSFHLGLLTQKVRIKNFKLYNPPGYPNKPMVDIPEVSVDFDVKAFLGGKLHLGLLVLDLKEMVLVKNKDGVLNVDALKVIKDAKKPGEKKESAKTEKGAKIPPMQIDLVKMNLGRVVIEDYTQDPPSVTAHDIDVKDKTFKDIKSPEQLVTLILFQAMSSAGIRGAAIYGAASVLGVAFLPAGVAGVLLGKDSSTAEFASSVPDVFAAAQKLINETGKVKSADQAGGTIKAVVDGCDVTLKVEKKNSRTMVTVSARKMMIPKADVAGGIIYRLQKQVK